MYDRRKIGMEEDFKSSKILNCCAAVRRSLLRLPSGSVFFGHGTVSEPCHAWAENISRHFFETERSNLGHRSLNYACADNNARSYLVGGFTYLLHFEMHIQMLFYFSVYSAYQCIDFLDKLPKY